MISHVRTLWHSSSPDTSPLRRGKRDKKRKECSPARNEMDAIFTPPPRTRRTLVPFDKSTAHPSVVSHVRPTQECNPAPLANRDTEIIGNDLSSSNNSPPSSSVDTRLKVESTAHVPPVQFLGTWIRHGNGGDEDSTIE